MSDRRSEEVLMEIDIHGSASEACPRGLGYRDSFLGFFLPVLMAEYVRDIQRIVTISVGHLVSFAAAAVNLPTIHRG